jgi:hypothetical protein
MKALAVKWIDHSSFDLNSWRSLEDLGGLEDMHVVSIGWLIAETKTSLILAGHVSLDADKATGEIKIHKGTILKRTEIKLPKALRL